MTKKPRTSRAETRHQIVRGGRLVKWKGRVASIAPFVAGVVPAVTLGALLEISSAEGAWAGPCTVAANGTITVNNGNNTAGCEVSSIGAEIGNTSVWNTGFLVYSQSTNRTLAILSDLTTTLKGSGGIAVYNTNASYFSTFDAAGRTINLTITNTDANAAATGGDAIAKGGVGVSHGSTAHIGTLNLTMLDLPRGTSFSERFEHYGVVTGSSVNAGEGVPRPRVS